LVTSVQRRGRGQICVVASRISHKHWCSRHRRTHNALICAGFGARSQKPLGKNYDGWILCYCGGDDGSYTTRQFAISHVWTITAPKQELRITLLEANGDAVEVYSRVSRSDTSWIWFRKEKTQQYQGERLVKLVFEPCQ